MEFSVPSGFSVESQSSELVLTRVHFENRRSAPIWMKPDVVKRLEDGDEKLMQIIENAVSPTSATLPLKRSSTNSSTESNDSKRQKLEAASSKAMCKDGTLGESLFVPAGKNSPSQCKSEGRPMKHIWANKSTKQKKPSKRYGKKQKPSSDSKTCKGKPDDEKYVWTTEVTLLLFDEYKKYKKRKCHCRKAADIWEQISVGFKVNHSMNIKTNDIKNKWQSLMRSYKVFKKSGETDRTFQYMDEVQSCLEHVQENKCDCCESNDRSITLGSDIVWTYDMIELLLQEYELRLDKFNNPSVANTLLWKEISDAFLEKGNNLNRLDVKYKWTMLLQNLKHYSTSRMKSLKLPQYYWHLCKIVGNYDILKEKSERYKTNETFCENTTEESNMNSCSVWTDEATMCLLSEFKTLLTDIDCSYITKKSLWQELSNKLDKKGFKFGSEKLRGKWRNLLRLRKIYCEKDSNEPLDLKTCLLISKLNNLLEDHPSLDPINEATLVKENQNISQDDGVYMWTPAKEKLLLKEYHALTVNKCGALSLKRNVFWQTVCRAFTANGYSITTDKLETKWITLKDAYQKAVCGNRVRYFPYMEEMKALLQFTSIEKTCSGKEKDEKDEDRSFEWTPRTEMLLLNEYQKLITNNNSTNGPEFWQNLCNTFEENGHVVTSKMMESKWNQFIRAYRRACQGDTVLPFPYMEEMRIILEHSSVKICWHKPEVDDHMDETTQNTPIWSNEAVIMLLDEYEIHKDILNTGNNKNKLFWEVVSRSLCYSGFQFTAAQCEHKVTALFSRYKNAKYLFFTEGKPIGHFPYFVKIMKLLEEDANIGNMQDELEQHSITSNEEKITLWTHEGTLLLIKEFAARKNKFDHPNIDKKQLWSDIERMFISMGYCFSSSELETKWKSLVCKFKNILSMIDISIYQKEEHIVVKLFPYFPRMVHLLGLQYDKQEKKVCLDGADDNSIGFLPCLNTNDHNYHLAEKVLLNKETLCESHVDNSKDRPGLVMKVLKQLKEFERKQFELQIQQLNVLSSSFEQTFSTLNSFDELINSVEQHDRTLTEIENEKVKDFNRKQRKKVKILQKMLKAT